MEKSTPISVLMVDPCELPTISHELMTQQWCELHRLIEELSFVQARLGTPLEESADYDQVRDYGHRIRNKLHLMQLWAETGMVSRDEILLEKSVG